MNSCPMRVPIGSLVVHIIWCIRNHLAFGPQRKRVGTNQFNSPPCGPWTRVLELLQNLTQNNGPKFSTATRPPTPKVVCCSKQNLGTKKPWHPRRECEFLVQERRIHYGSAARMRILSARTQNPLRIHSENANFECKNAEFTMDPQREREFWMQERRIHYGSAARIRILRVRTQNSLWIRSENANSECKNADFTMDPQRECEFWVQECRIHYGSAARMQILSTRTQTSLWIRSENANFECKNAEFTMDPQRECEFWVQECRIHYGSAARMRILSPRWPPTDPKRAKDHQNRFCLTF